MRNQLRDRQVAQFFTGFADALARCTVLQYHSSGIVLCSGRTTLSHGHIDVPSMARARGRNPLTRTVLSGAWTIGASASVCPHIGGSAGASQHATEPYPLPNLHAFLFPLAATTDLLISIHYVSTSIYVYNYTPFQFPVHLLPCSESVREKDKEGPSRSSTRSTATSLQIPR